MLTHNHTSLTLTVTVTRKYTHALTHTHTHTHTHVVVGGRDLLLNYITPFSSYFSNVRNYQQERVLQLKQNVI